jgi:HAD superfamily phosphoserine phosphatase-like hydrolase
VRERKEIQEVKEVEEIKEKSGSVAAFFDLDGTLRPSPSMERRFFQALRCRQAIGIRNYSHWLVEMVRLAPRGIGQIVHANKMYLRGVRADEALCRTDALVCRLAENGEGKTEEGREGREQERRRQPSMPVLRFFHEAVERLAWHAERAHLIVILSGTLEPLAAFAARALEAELQALGLAHEIRVCATQLEEIHGRWTGRIVGEAMFGAAKARAIRRMAAEADLDLSQCYAYGDSSSDQWMLETVGKPIPVNPSNDLEHIARRNDWVVLRWRGENNFTQRTPRAQGSQRTEATRNGWQAESEKSEHGA